MSTDERWDRLSAAHEQARCLDADAQARYLRELATRDPEMAHVLTGMLGHDHDALPILDRLDQAVAALVPERPMERLPSRVGRYRILRQIGEGGMGRVYLVERDAVGGHAALKVLRDAWASPERRQRFAREQETLARLSHPGIAQLFEVGALPDGTPWFAMELVEGLPLVDSVAIRGATVRDRLALVRAICSAVQHAHAHAVIHRDIKPSNVMVTTAGDVKLLDFGIAKQVGADAPDDDRTQTGYRMLTPDYAAPEQFSGDPIGVQTDVHAIGVMLYELLALRLPWASSRLTPQVPLAEQRRGIPDLVTTAKHGPVAPGRANWRELDVLVQTAIHQDPARRYASVEALGRDIDHYLANEPLEARPDTLRYRTGRLIRRQWRALTTAALVVGTILALSLGYARGLASARDEARVEADRTARIQAFMMGLFQGGEAEAGPADTLHVRTLIERGAREADALDGDPLLQAEVRETLGELRRQLGDVAGSDTLLTAALVARRRLRGHDHPDVARSLLALARLRMDQARIPAADSLITEAVRIATTTLPPDHPVRLDAIATRGRLAQDDGRLEDAERDQLIVANRLAASDPTSEATAGALVDLANTAFYAGALDRSDSLNQRALAIYRSRRGDRHPLVADVLINLGASAFERGKYGEAERFDREALDRIRSWYGTQHPETASALTLLGRALVFQSRSAEADSVLREALQILERTLGPDHPRVASASNELGTLALQEERYDEAERYFRQNATIYRHIYGPRHWLLGIAEGNLASVALARGDNVAAERGYREALAQFLEGQGPEHLNTAIAHVKLGRALLRQGRFHEAAQESRTGYDLLMAREQAPEGFVKAARKDLAEAYDRLGDREAAVRFGPQLPPP
ncbi:MAG TPA: serine/threonine-protein kinase [Gemmatimonadales bacterium]|nr:serine/threonine-protein kinase [Gemmatimonadales bacterium]